MAQPDLVEPLESDDEALGGSDAGGLISGVVAQELGEAAAHTFARVWRAQEDYERQRRPNEGLRERKKRLTRQRISDVATALFVARGFDQVTVAQVAERVGVSEKTVYNYFPSKESLVFDQADEQMAALASALRERPRGVSPTAAMLGALKRETARLDLLSSDLDFLVTFGEMIRAAPSLRAFWAEQRNRLVEAVTAILAGEAGVDPRDPEPLAAARALVSIQELFYESYVRHVEDGVRGSAIRAAVEADLERAARLLDTGLWSLHLMAQGRRTKQQLLDAAAAAEQARKQVVAALRQAKRTWRELRPEQRTMHRARRAEQRDRHRG